MAIEAAGDRLDPIEVALVLPTMVGELLDAAALEDWYSIAAALIEAYRDARGEEV